MNKWNLSFAFLLSLSATDVFAAAMPLQQIQVANVLYNQDAPTIGVTGTAVTVKFYVAGASTPCATVPLVFQGVTSISSGSSGACKTAITTVAVDPVAVPSVGTLYSPPTNFTVDTTLFATQLIIQQRTLTPPSTSYGPIFNTSNGTVATPGTAVITSQAHYRRFKMEAKNKIALPLAFG